MSVQSRLLLTYREAGKELAVCEKTVANMVRDGRLRAVRLGRAVRIAYAELIALIERQQAEGGSHEAR